MPHFLNVDAVYREHQSPLELVAPVIGRPVTLSGIASTAKGLDVLRIVSPTASQRDHMVRLYSLRRPAAQAVRNGA